MSLSIRDLTIVFGVFFILFVIAGAYIFYRYSKNKPEQKSRNYNLKNLIFPYNKKAGLRKNLSSIFFSPYFWAFQILVLVVLSYMVIGSHVFAKGKSEILLPLFSSGLITLGFTFFYTVIVWLADYKEHEPLRFIPTMFFWGSIAALVAALLNTQILSLIELSKIGGSALIIIILFVGPLLEETLKGLGLIVFYKNKEFDDMMDGIFYGFVIGMGFAFIEDWIYYIVYSPFSIGLENWLSLIFMRTVVTGVAHGVFTAITGAMLGLMKTRFMSKTSIIGILVASTLAHMIFNLSSVVENITKLNTDLFAAIILLAALVIMIKLALTKYAEKKKV